jgi:hypothetical protein
MFRTLTPIFSIVIAVAVFFFFAQPMFSEIKVVQDETNEYRIAVEKASEFNQLLQSLISKRNAFSARERERLEALVPDNIDEVKLLVDLEGIAKSHGMLLGNIMVSELTPATATADDEGSRIDSRESFSSVDISFDVIGNYEQLRSVLTDIERSLVLMEIVNITFESSSFDLQQYSITVRAYGFPPVVSS